MKTTVAHIQEPYKQPERNFKENISNHYIRIKFPEKFKDRRLEKCEIGCIILSIMAQYLIDAFNKATWMHNIPISSSYGKRHSRFSVVDSQQSSNQRNRKEKQVMKDKLKCRDRKQKSDMKDKLKRREKKEEVGDEGFQHAYGRN